MFDTPASACKIEEEVRSAPVSWRRKKPKWRNWQTRMVQVHVPARVWGFESLLRHQNKLSSCPGEATSDLSPALSLRPRKTPFWKSSFTASDSQRTRTIRKLNSHSSLGRELSWHKRRSCLQRSSAGCEIWPMI